MTTAERIERNKRDAEIVRGTLGKLNRRVAIDSLRPFKKFVDRPDSFLDAEHRDSVRRAFNDLVAEIKAKHSATRYDDIDDEPGTRTLELCEAYQAQLRMKEELINA
jgi:hypothetical protein